MTITNENYEIILHALEASGQAINSNDTLEFHVNDNVLRYLGRARYLDGINCNNDEIFRVLGITDKYAFCEKVYGHEPIEGWFPEAKEDYSESVIKIARALFDLCVQKSVRIQAVSTIELKNSSILNSLQDDLDVKPKHLDWLDIPF